MSFNRVSLSHKTSEKTSDEPAEKPISFRSRVVIEPDGDAAITDHFQEVDSDMFTGVSRRVVIGVLIAVVLLGTGSGYGVARLMAAGGANYQVETSTPEEVENKIQAGAVFGVPDEKTFKDDAEGVLIKGGLSGEGSHTLLRPGGESQNVYLTSSVVDLDQFVDARVQVWGETFKGQKAGWLMDVGRLEIKELAAAKPDWYQADQEEKTSQEDQENNE